MQCTLRVAALLAAFLAVDLAQAGPAEDYIDAQVRVVRGLQARLDSITDTAERAAKGLTAGGEIYLAGEPGMIAELLGRAGGLCGAKAIAPGKPLPKFHPGDVVLYSDYGLPHRLAGRGWNDLCRSGVLMVAFASAQNPILRAPLPANVRAIPVDVPLQSCLIKSASGTAARSHGHAGRGDRPVGLHRRADRGLPAAAAAIGRLPEHLSR